MFTVLPVPSLLKLYTIMYCTHASFIHNWHWTVPLPIFTILPVPSITSSNVTTRYHGCFQTLLFELYRLYQYWYQFKWQCWHLSFFSHIFPIVLPVVPSIYCITRVAQIIPRVHYNARTIFSGRTTRHTVHWKQHKRCRSLPHDGTALHWELPLATMVGRREGRNTSLLLCCLDETYFGGNPRI